MITAPRTPPEVWCPFVVVVKWPFHSPIAAPRSKRVGSGVCRLGRGRSSRVMRRDIERVEPLLSIINESLFESEQMAYSLFLTRSGGSTKRTQADKT